MRIDKLSIATGINIDPTSRFEETLPGLGTNRVSENVKD